MTSSTAQTTGSSLDVGHGNSFFSHSRCGNVNVGAIPCSESASFPSHIFKYIIGGGYSDVPQFSLKVVIINYIINATGVLA